MLKRKFLALLMIACLLTSVGMMQGALADVTSASLSISGTTATVTFSGSPDEPVTVTLWYKGVVKETKTANITSGSGSCTFTISATDYGDYQAVAGSQNSNVVTVTDPTPPAPTSDITMASLAATNSTTLTATYSGTPATLAVKVELYHEGGLAQTFNDTLSGGNGSHAFTISATDYGQYQVRVSASDDGSVYKDSNVINVDAPASTEITNVTLAASNNNTTLTTTYKGKPNTDVKVVLYYQGVATQTINGSIAANGAGTSTFTIAATAGGQYQTLVYYTNGSSAMTATNTSPNLLVGTAPTPTPAPKDLTISSVTLVGRNQLRVVGKGAPNGQAKLDVTGGPSLNITIDNNGDYDDIIPNLPVGTYTQVTASYVGTSPTYGASPATFTGTWKVEAATANDLSITKVTASTGAVTITGKGKAGATITATVGGKSGGATIDASGNFSITIQLPAGTYTGAQVKYDATGIGNGASIADKIVVPGSSTPTPGGTYPTLSRGMTGSYVTVLQQWLKSLGYYTIKVDGIFGVGTQTAVRNFQIMNNLPANGIADDAMQKLLYSGNAIGITPTTPPSGYTTLSYGSRGTAVRSMQVRLANLGYYYGSIDGIFGSQTQAAVRNFQNRNNLAVNGIADSATQSAMYSSSAIPNSNSSSGYVYLHYGSRGSAVTRLQTALKNLGYYKGALDGQYYDQTYAAVKSFQRANGLVVDGIAGKKTQNKLYGTNY